MAFTKPNGMGGNPYNGGTDMKGVKAVHVRSGWYIDAIKFDYKSGRQTASYGGKGGKLTTFSVGASDHIVQVNVWQGWGTDAVQFITREGKKSGKIGGCGGALKVYKAACGQALTGFHGRSGLLVDKFVPVFGPVISTRPMIVPDYCAVKNVINISAGDVFKYGPWGGACKVHFVNGCLRLYRISRGINTKIMSWRCQSVSDTLKFLRGEAVMIRWDERGTLKCQVKDGNTIAVTHSSGVYYFKRAGIKVTVGDKFYCGLFGGVCKTRFIKGILVFYLLGKGKNNAAFSWQCKNAADTKLLLQGVKVTLTCQGKPSIQIQCKDRHTFTVWQGRRANILKRMSPKITIKEGDRFAYGPWGGECVATYKNGCLRFYRKSRGVNTVIMSWQCATPEDTVSLLTGGRVNIIWDGRGRLSMRVKDTNCLEVMHGKRPYYFRRMKPVIDLKAGDLFAYGPWGGECKAQFIKGVLRFYRTSRGVNTTICSWKCKSRDDTRALICGGAVQILWDGKDYKKCEVLDSNTIAVTHGTAVYKFTRMEAKLTIKTGDSWNYSPWGGQCFAHFVAGVLKVYRADRGPNTVQCAWQCQSAEDTRELLAGLTVQVIWDGVDKKNCKLTKDLCGFTVQHGATWYDFTKDINVQQKVITINEGDQFHYGPWGGLCIAHYVNGILRFYRKSRGKKTVVMSWNCVSAADTLKLLAGGTVDITWDGRGKKPMRVKDEHTLAVTHGTTVYYFIRKFSAVVEKPTIVPAGTQAPETHMHLWGINAGSNIYYRDYVIGKPARWIKVPGQLYRVSVSADGNHIWGMNGGGNIYYRQGFKGSWQLVPGKLLHKSIAVSGDGSHVWGVNKQMDIYYRQGFSGAWQHVPGKLVKIAVSQCGGHVWGCNKDDNIYYRPGFGGSWVHVHGKLKQIAISANGAHIWGVNRTHDIFYRAAGAASWTKVPGKLVTINVSGDGRYVWGTNKGQDIFFKDFSLGLMSAWTKTTHGKLVYISVSNHWVTLNGNIQTKPAIIDDICDVDDDDDSVDLVPDGPDSDIDSDGEETDVDDEEPPFGNYNPDPEDSDSDSDDDIDGADYDVDDPDDDDAPKNGKFTCVPGKFIMVNVSLDGKHVWGCTTDFKVYYRTGVNGEWQEVDAPPMQWVSVSGDGSKVYGVTANDKGRCFFRDGGFIGEWKQIDGFMKQICVSANGEHVWGVNYDELVFYRKGGGYEGVPSWKVDGLHASHIAVSANGDHVWGLQSKAEFPRIFHRQGYGAGSADEWEEMGGCAQTIHCSDAKTCWSINAADNVFERLPEDTVGRKWKRVDGYMEQISVSENAEHVWGVDPDGNVWYFGSEELV